MESSSDEDITPRYPRDVRILERNIEITSQDLRDMKYAGTSCGQNDKFDCSKNNQPLLLDNHNIRNSNPHAPMVAANVAHQVDNINCEEQLNRNNLTSSQTDYRDAAANVKRKRIKWSHEMNKQVMQSFYFVSNCNDIPPPGWRQSLHDIITTKFPNLNLSEQNVVDRKHLIVKKKYLNQLELDHLKREVGKELHHEQIVEEIRINTSAVKEFSAEDEMNLSQNLNNADDDVLEKTRDLFLSTIQFFENSNPLDRPKLPKFIPKPGATEHIYRVNEILRDYVKDDVDISRLHTTIYAAAVTVLELNNQKPCHTGKSTTNKQNKEPAWKVRLIKDIDNYRAKADIILEYSKGARSNKVVKKVQDLCSNNGIDLNEPNVNSRLDELRDLYRQKAKVKGARLHRYNLTTKRKIQNKEFQQNEKLFYRKLNDGDVNKIDHCILKQNQTIKFWDSIWGTPVYSNKNAEWIHYIEDQISNLDSMIDTQITIEDVQAAIVKTANWKATGPDNIQNFWVKQFTTLHSAIAKNFNKALDEPNYIPQFLTMGKTSLIYKTGDPNDPKNYRPITCLSVIYKLLTSIINSKIYKYVSDHNLISPEQKGCIKKSLGCKEQLTIDTIILKKAQVKKRNLYACYIDYAKAYDSVPHDWLLKVLDLYKICPNIKNLLASLMKSWRITLYHNNNKLGDVAIKRGIFQGDSLSPIWFCLCINPLSSLLNMSPAGFRLNIQDQVRFSHILYMDDLKIYAESQKQLECLINTTKLFSNDIQMKFGIDKCAMIGISRGKIKQVEEIMDIQALTPEQSYKYLGILQHRGINHTIIKAAVMKNYKFRVTKLLNTRLASRNMIKAINTWAVPILTYSFGVLKWSDTDLAELDRLTRRMLTKFRFLHPNSSVARLYLPRSEGGRGLLNIARLCKSQVINIRKYFHAHTDSRIKKICESDISYTPLNLSDRNLEISQSTVADGVQSWKEKVLHGKFALQLNDTTIDKDSSISWLKKGVIYPETEGFMLSIQDKVVRTRNYEKNILKMSVNDKCRKCERVDETIEHITAGCPLLAESAYLGRHNQVAKIIHQQLATKYELIKTYEPYYKYTPNPVLEANTTLLYWDRPIITDKTVDYNKPDIILIDKQNNTGLIIDVAVPLTHNIVKTEHHKIEKYINLAIEIKRIWKLKEIRVIPIVISVDGVVSKDFHKHLKNTKLNSGLFTIMQRAVILQTCHITRKFFAMG